VLAVGSPTALLLGHGRGIGWATAAGDLWFGVVWQLFVWTGVGELVRLALLLIGVPDPTRARSVAAVVIGWTVLRLAWGAFRALGPVPVREREVRIAGLGAGLDGLRIGQLTDTHLGPFLTRRWTQRITAQVHALDVDLLAHTGDLVDGSLAARAHQVEPLGAVTARDARVFITGNHEQVQRVVTGRAGISLPVAAFPSPVCADPLCRITRLHDSRCMRGSPGLPDCSVG
jgi:uncharacterized protein